MMERLVFAVLAIIAIFFIAVSLIAYKKNKRTAANIESPVGTKLKVTDGGGPRGHLYVEAGQVPGYPLEFRLSAGPGPQMSLWITPDMRVHVAEGWTLERALQAMFNQIRKDCRESR